LHKAWRYFFAKIQIKSGRRIRVDCEIKFNNKDLSRLFKFDTGAQNTCLSARDIGIRLTEEEFIKEFNPTFRFEGTGIDDSSSVIFYQIMVEDFSVEGEHLGVVPIYISFDKNYSKRLLGLDLLNLLNYSIDNDGRTLEISQTKMLAEHIDKNLPITTEEMVKMGLYDPVYDLDYLEPIFFCTPVVIHEMIHKIISILVPEISYNLVLVAKKSPFYQLSNDFNCL
jgi:hypothetical protein